MRARDQLGELAESFNVMTGEVTKLLSENAEKARMEQEMLAAREIQQKLLPVGPAERAWPRPSWRSANRHAKWRATTTTSCTISDTKLGVLIADVSGKGLPAGLYMAQLKVIVQSLARVHTSPRDFLMAVNRVVADNIDSKSFITMSYGVIDLERREMVFARAGHCPLIHVPGQRAARPAQVGVDRARRPRARAQDRRRRAVRRDDSGSDAFRSAPTICWCSSPTASARR